MSCTLEDVYYAHESSIHSLSIGESGIQKKSFHWIETKNDQGRNVLKRVATLVPSEQILKIKQ